MPNLWTLNVSSISWNSLGPATDTLRHLRVLSLSGISLLSNLPDLKNKTKLITLELKDLYSLNPLVDSCFNNTPNLATLVLQNLPMLYGDLPSSMENLNLQRLRIQAIGGTSTFLPTFLLGGQYANGCSNNLVSLEIIDMPTLNSIPSIGLCSALSKFVLRRSALGVIDWRLLPPSLQHLELSYSNLNTLPLFNNIHTLIVSGNPLKPYDLSYALSQNQILTHLEASNCLLDSDLDISTAAKLQYVDISSNTFRAFPAAFFSRLASVQYFSISNNSLIKQELPQSFFSSGSWPQLETLRLDECNFIGNFPESIASLPRLVSLNTSGNLFTTIPNSIGQLKLKVLDFSRNELVFLPADWLFQNITSLTIIDLSSNPGLSGQPLPKFWTKMTGSGRVPNIKINLADCGFLGSMTAPFFPSSALIHTFNISRNGLTGVAPFTDINFAGKILNIDLSYNRFSAISTLWASGTGLTFLDLSYNRFSTNSPSFNRLDSLKTLRLNNNQFFGSVPVPPVSTEYFDISNNQFDLCTVSSTDQPRFVDLRGCNLSNNACPGTRNCESFFRSTPCLTFNNPPCPQ